MLFWASGVCAQAPERPRFEVATVKQMPPRTDQVIASLRGGPGTEDPRRFTATGFNLSELIVGYYNLSPNQYSMPAWMLSARYDITGLVPPVSTKAQLRQMVRSLLEERLGLKYHVETRQILIYVLVVAKGGVKMRSAAPPPAKSSSRPVGPGEIDKDGFPVLPPGPGYSMIPARDGIRMRGSAQTPAQIAGMLRGQVGRPVEDRTGLAGLWDYTLAFDPSASSAIPRPADPNGTGEASDPISGLNVFGAVKRQLGLELKPDKGAAPFFVVDSAQRVPASN